MTCTFILGLLFSYLSHSTSYILLKFTDALYHLPSFALNLNILTSFLDWLEQFSVEQSILFIDFITHISSNSFNLIACNGLQSAMCCITRALNQKVSHESSLAVRVDIAPFQVKNYCNIKKLLVFGNSSKAIAILCRPKAAQLTCLF